MIVFYDGTCALCDGLVRSLLAADRRGVLRYAPLGGETARAAGVPREADSIVYLRGGVKRVKSDAVLGILWDLGGAWRATACFRAVPRFLRDALYDAVARRRARWFGRCGVRPLPPPPVRERFLP